MYLCNKEYVKTAEFKLNMLCYLEYKGMVGCVRKQEKLRNTVYGSFKTNKGRRRTITSKLHLYFIEVDKII